MARLNRRPLAFDDLADLWSFIANDSEAAADRYLDTLETKLQLLATQPRMGRERPELMPGVRSFPFDRYVVFFLSLSDGIELVRVLHSARDITPEDFDAGPAAAEDKSLG